MKNILFVSRNALSTKYIPDIILRKCNVKLGVNWGYQGILQHSKSSKDQAQSKTLIALVLGGISGYLYLIEKAVNPPKMHPVGE